MILSLVIRNLLRNGKRLRPVIIVLVLSFALIFVANSIFYSINASYSSGLRNGLSGDMTISAASMANFTLLGPSGFMVSDYYRPDKLVDAGQLITYLDEEKGVAHSMGVVTVIATLQLHPTIEQKIALEEYYENYRVRNVEVARHPDTYYQGIHSVLGLDFSRVPAVLPGLELVSGSFPAPGERGFLMQESVFEKSNRWVDPLLQPMRFTSSLDNSSFVIRDVPLTGVFRIKGGDSRISSLVLLDMETAVDLAGLRAVPEQEAGLDDETAFLFSDDIDSLFGDSAFGDSEVAGDDEDWLDKTESLFSDASADQAVSGATVETLCHFVIVNLKDGVSTAEIRKELSKSSSLDPGQYLLRDWRQSIGGSVVLAFVLLVVLNAGALLVVFGVLLLAVNSMMLSIFERTPEFGAMRAIGAPKKLLVLMVTLETVILVLGSALAGVAMGVLGSLLVNAAKIAVYNPFLVLLFGGSRLNGLITAPLVLLHLGGALVLGLFSAMHPLRKVLEIVPSRAMS